MSKNKVITDEIREKLVERIPNYVEVEISYLTLILPYEAVDPLLKALEFAEMKQYISAEGDVSGYHIIRSFRPSDKPKIRILGHKEYVELKASALFNMNMVEEK